MPQCKVLAGWWERRKVERRPIHRNLQRQLLPWIPCKSTERQLKSQALEAARTAWRVRESHHFKEPLLPRPDSAQWGDQIGRVVACTLKELSHFKVASCLAGDSVTRMKLQCYWCGFLSSSFNPQASRRQGLSLAALPGYCNLLLLVLSVAVGFEHVQAINSWWAWLSRKPWLQQTSPHIRLISLLCSLPFPKHNLEKETGLS